MNDFYAKLKEKAATPEQVLEYYNNHRKTTDSEKVHTSKKASMCLILRLTTWSIESAFENSQDTTALMMKLWSKASRISKSEPERMGPTVALARKGKAMLVVQRIMAEPDGRDKPSEPRDVAALAGPPVVPAKKRGNAYVIEQLEEGF